MATTLSDAAEGPVCTFVPEVPSVFTEEREESRHVSAPSAKLGPLSIVVFGASGDLAKKKTFPALFNLFNEGFVASNGVQIFGYGRSQMSDEDLHAHIRQGIKEGPVKSLSAFLNIVHYIHGPYEGRDGYAKLQEAMLTFELKAGGEVGPTRRLFYLALPPSVYPPVCAEIKNYCMNARGWTHVVVEKPFGRDTASCEALNSELAKLFTEEQVYRIDHYLGKELAQNLLVMRFTNRFFLPLWNRDNIDNVQIVFREDFGTQGRGGYFDQYGIIRDVVQNHLTQVLCLLAMEKPVSLAGDDIRDEKVRVLRSVAPILDEEVVLGQYKGYLDDPTVPAGSKTPTLVALVLRVKNERWDGVPFIVKAGKAMDSRKAEIRVQFKDVPGDIYGMDSHSRDELVIRIQPAEAMYIKLSLKKPGLEMAVTMSEMDLSYQERYQGCAIPEAYERLILDCIKGDQQHFVRRDEQKAAWEIFTPLLQRIDKGELTVLQYEPGSRGPPEADALAEKVGYKRTEGYCWRPPTLQE